MSVDEFMEPLAQKLESVGCENVVVAQSERERGNIWMVREESLGLEKKFPFGFWYDVSVPLNKLDAYIDRLEVQLKSLDKNIRIFAMGHLGDGNLHLTITRGAVMEELRSQISEIVYDGLTAMGASFSAEHGIGVEKLNDLARHCDSGKLQIMRLIKQALDPLNIMNPGKVIPDRID